jgi:hypothetical protein
MREMVDGNGGKADPLALYPAGCLMMGETGQDTDIDSVKLKGRREVI